MISCSDDGGPIAPEPKIGTIAVDPSPDSINAPWIVLGPENYRRNGSGDQTIDGLSPGEYTVNWGDVDGYITPIAEMKTLSADPIVTFSGTYRDAPGRIVIDQIQDDLPGASWSLTGPLSVVGAGDTTLTDMPAGEYSLAWSDVAGYELLASAPQALEANETVKFWGVYFNDEAFVINWDVTSNCLATLGLDGDVDATVFWGNGITSTVMTPNPSHHYNANGIYTIIVLGRATEYHNANTNCSRIVSVDQWGQLGFTNLSRAFSNESSLVSIPNHSNGIEAVTDMSNMFSMSFEFSGEIGRASCRERV